MAPSLMGLIIHRRKSCIAGTGYETARFAACTYTVGMAGIARQGIQSATGSAGVRADWRRSVETARLNAVCADTPLPGGVNPGPCDVTLAFRDMSGRMLKTMTVTLRPGEGRSLDFRGIESAALSRMEVQPYVAPAGHGFVLCTVELFETFTGRTSVALNPTEPRSLGGSAPAGQ